MTNDQTKTDLEWLFTRFGWQHPTWSGASLYGYPPEGWCTLEGWKLNPHCNHEFPHFDQDVNLMIELVGQLDESQWRNYLSILAGIVRPRDCFDWQQKLGVIHDMVQAPAHLRLRAYRMVMEGE